MASFALSEITYLASIPLSFTENCWPREYLAASIVPADESIPITDPCGSASARPAVSTPSPQPISRMCSLPVSSSSSDGYPTPSGAPKPRDNDCRRSPQTLTHPTTTTCDGTTCDGTACDGPLLRSDVTDSEPTYRRVFLVKKILEADLGKTGARRQREFCRGNRPRQLAFVVSVVAAACDQQQGPRGRHARGHRVERRPAGSHSRERIRRIRDSLYKAQWRCQSWRQGCIVQVLISAAGSAVPPHA